MLVMPLRRAVLDSSDQDYQFRSGIITVEWIRLQYGELDQAEQVVEDCHAQTVH